MASGRLCATCSGPIDRGPGAWTYCSEECRPECSFDGCNEPTRGKADLCSAHCQQRLRGGELKPQTYAKEWVCVVCGADVPKGSGRRQHCSSRCQVMHSRAKSRPKSFTCAICSTEVSLIVPSTKTGQFKRSDSRLCGKCKQRTKYGMNPREVAARDGTECKICGDPVDMNAGKSDLFRPSVDHVIPRSVGGTDDPSNLQLAHLWCNQVKNNRPEFSLRKAV